LQNIEHALLDELARLYREPDFLVREELHEVENYYMILMALSGAHCPAGESRDVRYRLVDPLPRLTSRRDCPAHPDVHPAA
jgi:hypothetical protein